MNLCIVTREYPASDNEPIVSGSIKNPYYLSKALSDRGHEVTVVTHDTLHEQRRQDGIEVRRVRGGLARGFVRSTTKSLRVATELRRLGRDGRSFDVVNVHYPAAGVALAKRLGQFDAPLVSTAHGTILPEIQANLGSSSLGSNLHLLNALAKKQVDQYSWHQSNLVVTPGRYQVAEMLDVYGLPESSVIPISNGVDTSLYRPDEERGRAARDRLGLRGATVVLFVGRLVRKKGLQYLLRALPIARSEVPDLHVLVVGGTPEFDEYGDTIRRMIADRDLEESVPIRTEVPECKLPAYYNAADVLAVPSTNYEPLPTVVFEAMASGLPVVGTNGWGIPEQLGYDETLVEQKNPDDLASVITAILGDDDRYERLSETNRRRAVDRYEWSKAAEAYEKAYNGLEN